MAACAWSQHHALAGCVSATTRRSAGGSPSSINCVHGLALPLTASGGIEAFGPHGSLGVDTVTAMPSYSFGHRWVGIVAGSEPPAQQTLMAIAAGHVPSSGPSRAARSRSNTSAPVPVWESSVPLTVRQRHAWHQLMLEALTADERKQLNALKHQSDQAIRERNAAANRVSAANRAMKKRKPGLDLVAVREDARAAAAEVARIKLHQQALLVARERLFSEPAKRVLELVRTDTTD
jgi:hypothetical protein